MPLRLQLRMDRYGPLVGRKEPDNHASDGCDRGHKQRPAATLPSPCLLDEDLGRLRRHVAKWRDVASLVMEDSPEAIGRHVFVVVPIRDLHLWCYSK